MPGQAACFRCGSVLEAEATVEVHPPRASQWKKPFRQVRYWLRQHTSLGQAETALERTGTRSDLAAAKVMQLLDVTRKADTYSPTRDVARALIVTMGWIMFSALPGLPQIIRKRFLAVWQIWISCVMSVAFGLFLFGGTWGAISLGIGAVFHAWLGVDAAQLTKRGQKLLPRLTLAMGLAIIWVCFLYYGVRVTLLRSIYIEPAAVAVPAQQVEIGDDLLCRRFRPDSPPLERGDMVLVRSEGGRSVTQLIGLPGETVGVSADHFVVNGQVLDPDQYPVQDWNSERRGPRPLRDNEYFVRMRYSMDLQGRRGRRVRHVGIVERELVIGREDILGYAVMRWLPLPRRGFLSEDTE